MEGDVQKGEGWDRRTLQTPVPPRGWGQRKRSHPKNTVGGKSKQAAGYGWAGITSGRQVLCQRTRLLIINFLC